MEDFRLANQSPDLNPIEHAFHLLKRRFKQTITERGFSRSQEKLHKIRMQQFGDVRGLVQLLQANYIQPNI